MASNNRREPQTHHTEAEAEADAENEAENESEAENENENENETTVVKKQPTTTTTPKKTSGEQEQEEEEEEEEEGKPELIIYTLDRDHKTYSMSLFATKLHLRLRHGGIRYENAMGNRGDAPKEKFPYVRFVGGGDHDDDGGDGDDDGDGRFMGDSALIVERLVKRGKLEDLMMGSGVSEEIRAMDLCLRVLVEDRLYYLIVSYFSSSLSLFLLLLSHHEIWVCCVCCVCVRYTDGWMDGWLTMRGYSVCLCGIEL